MATSSSTTPTAGDTGSDVARPKNKIMLTGNLETLMFTLCCRKVDGESPYSILHDKWAVEASKNLDYDFNKLGLKSETTSSMALRSRKFDDWTREFLDANPHSTVVHLACGLDSRAHRVKRGPGVRWIDIDLPEVVEIRKAVMTDPEDGDYSLVAASVAEQTSDGWLQTIPADRPTLIVFEGLVMYLTPEDGQALIRRLVTRFSVAGGGKGGQLLFDCVGLKLIEIQLTLSWVRSTGAKFTWGVGDAKELEEIHKSLKLKDSISAAELPWGVREVAIRDRLLWFMISYLPGYKDMVRLLRFDYQ
jgi:O-methyltransferase involved in polyketide biosynthesis